MRKTGVYTINTSGSGASGQTFDNPAFDVEQTDQGVADRGGPNEVPVVTDIRNLKEVPEEPGDVIKLVSLLMFILASFVIGIAVTGANV